MRTDTSAITSWIDIKLPHFQFTPGAGIKSFSQLKPMGEFILVLYSLANSKTCNDVPDLRYWSLAKGTELQPVIDEFGAAIDWNMSPDELTVSPVNSSSLLMFRAIKAITGTPTTWDPLIEPVFLGAALPRVPENILLLFVEDILGLYNAHDLALDMLFEVIENQRPGAISYASIYLVTHYIIYASKMGVRPVELSGARSAALRAYLSHALDITIENKHFDMIGELVMCMNWVDCRADQSYSIGLGMLVEAVSAYGFVPNTTKRSPMVVDDFSVNYHPTIVALAAIGQSKMCWN